MLNKRDSDFIRPLGSLLSCGKQLSQQGADADDEEATISDPEYLMEVMEAREAVDAADPHTLQSLHEDYKQEENDSVKVSISFLSSAKAYFLLKVTPVQIPG